MLKNKLCQILWKKKLLKYYILLDKYGKKTV